VKGATSIRQIVKNAFHALGYEPKLYSAKALGVDPFRDISRLVDREQRVIAFDVGANIGQSTLRLRGVLPSCEIHAFEPSETAFVPLSYRVRSCGNVYLNNVGVGSSCEIAPFFEHANTDMSSFLTMGRSAWGKILKQVPVQITTLDRYCEERHISYITVLKSDTQGYDLEVLKGAEGLMGRNQIQLVYTEIQFDDMYQGSPTFDQLFRFLVDRNFRLVSIYDFHHQNNLASWSDALFINTSFGAGRMTRV